MTEIVSRKEFNRMKIEYRIYLIAVLLFSSVIGYAIGVNYDVCGLR